MRTPPWNEHHEFRRPYKPTQIQESGKILLVAYRILGFGLKYSSLGMQNPPAFEIWNPLPELRNPIQRWIYNENLVLEEATFSQYIELA